MLIHAKLKGQQLLQQNNNLIIQYRCDKYSAQCQTQWIYIIKAGVCLLRRKADQTQQYHQIHRNCPQSWTPFLVDEIQRRTPFWLMKSRGGPPLVDEFQRRIPFGGLYVDKFQRRTPHLERRSASRDNFYGSSGTFIVFT